VPEYLYTCMECNHVSEQSEQRGERWMLYCVAEKKPRLHARVYEAPSIGLGELGKTPPR